MARLAQLIDTVRRERQKGPQGGPEASMPSLPEVSLLSLLGKIQIQVGNVEAAEDAFNQQECLLREPDSSVEVRLNRYAVMCDRR